MDPVDCQVARMMRWHGRAETTVAVLLVLLVLPLVLRPVIQATAPGAIPTRSWNYAPAPQPGMTVTGGMIVAAIFWPIVAGLFCLISCWAILGWQIFKAGGSAFGVPAGVGYALLELVVLPLCGVPIAALSDPRCRPLLSLLYAAATQPEWVALFGLQELLLDIGFYVAEPQPEWVALFGLMGMFAVPHLVRVEIELFRTVGAAERKGGGKR